MSSPRDPPDLRLRRDRRRRFAHASHWGFRLLAGGAFGDAPQVDLNASVGILSNDPTFQARLAQEEADIQDDADDYKVLPVVQAGVT